MAKIGRDVLKQFLPNHETIVAFEQMFKSVETALPDGVEAATALAYAASALANLAVSMLTQQAEQIEQLSFLPSAVPVVPNDQYYPAFPSGTLGQQNADSVEITGGSIDGTTVGATTASTGAFTTLTASGAVTLSPANANVVLSPTGTGVVTISPATLGTMDKVTIGGTTPAAGTFTTVNKITFTQPAVSATFTLATGKIFTVSNTLTMTATDGATLAIGGGGTLGSAAYTSSGTYALLAGSASQAFSTLALTNAGNLTVGSANGSDYIIKPGDGTNTGKLQIQPGGGSGGYGGSLVLYSHSNATHPGDVVNSISTSSGGSFRITSGGLDTGTTVFTVVGATGATTILGGFGCNSKTAQTAYALGADSTDLPTVITLANNIRAALIANGIAS